MERRAIERIMMFAFIIGAFFLVIGKKLDRPLLMGAGIMGLGIGFLTWAELDRIDIRRKELEREWKKRKKRSKNNISICS